MIEIIHKSKDFVICKKPVGVHSQKADDKNMIEMLANTLGIESDSVYPVHRLDNLVGGTMLYATTKESAKVFSRLVCDNGMKKRYLAVIHGKPQNSADTLKDLLFKDSAKNKTFVVNRMRKGVKEASLEYEVLKTVDYEGKLLTLAKILLHTGRTHQIRVQFASRGMPLVGDRRYGSGKDGCNVALYSHSLEFENPFTKELESYKTEPNWDEYPWRVFK